MKKQLIYCNCQGDIIDNATLENINSEVQKSTVSTVELKDMCGLAAKNKPELKAVFELGNENLIIACEPRAVDRLLQYAGIETSKLNIRYLNIREQSVDEIGKSIEEFTSGSTETATIKKLESPEEWPSWYPIVDYDRCTGCGQCADFCLFGVYTKSENRVDITNPSGCKNNCPACARICPHTAIIFPKYQQGGAISGSDTINEIEEQKRQKQDVDDILGSDIYKALEKRKKRRKSIISDTAMKKALDERERALGKED